MNYPKFRVKNQGHKYKIQVKRLFWPFWYDFEEGYYGVYTYNTIERAEVRRNEIIEHVIKEKIAIEKAKDEIKNTNEELSASDYIKKYPEKFL